MQGVKKARAEARANDGARNRRRGSDFELFGGGRDAVQFLLE